MHIPAHWMPSSTRPVLARRLVTIPSVLIVTVLATALAPLGLLIALVVDLIALGRLSVTRTALFFLALLWAETIGVVAAFAIWLFARDPGAFAAANVRLQRRWGMFLFRAAVRLFSVQVAVRGAERLAGAGACLFYVRHASTLDTLLPLVVDARRRFRYVLKEELLVDPCLDIVGHRLPNCFVRRGSDRSEAEVQRVKNLAHGVADDEAIVIFPEGTRFTREKRERFAAREDAGRLARELQHTLSPLRAGAVALAGEAETADFVIIAHRGVERAGTLGDLLTGGLTRAHLEIEVRRFPAPEVPRDELAFRDWLAARWREVDAFVAGATSLNGARD